MHEHVHRISGKKHKVKARSLQEVYKVIQNDLNHFMHLVFNENEQVHEDTLNKLWFNFPHDLRLALNTVYEYSKGLRQ